MTGPTQGPWTVEPEDEMSDWKAEQGPTGKWAVAIPLGPAREALAYCEKEEYARLIAAAPETAAELERAQETIADLLKALKELAACEHDPKYAREVFQAGTAIQKAEAAISRATTGTGAQG